MPCILIFPGIMLALIGVHLALVWFKHTQFPGPGRTRNVVGVRVMPVFAVKSGAFFAMIVGILGLMGGLLQINPVWQLGPLQALPGLSRVPAGLLHAVDRRTDPAVLAWDIYIGNHTIPAAVWVAVIMGIVFLLLIIYPFLEKRFTGDDAHQTCCSVRGTSRFVPESGQWRSPSTWC